MKNQNQLPENFNELVFEHRNKAYGAYAIRKSYHENMSKSLLLSISFFSLLVLIGALLSNKSVPKIKLDPAQKIENILNTIYDVTPPEKPKPAEPVKAKELPKPKTDELNVVASDKKVETTLKTNDIIKIVTNGDIKGKDSLPPTDFPPVKTTFKGTETDKTDDIKPIADEMPEFNGDLFRYLSEKLKYPTIAVEARTQGTVYLTFVVEKNGEIGDIKILKGVSEGCTEEAIRVVKSMPKWKPGKNHGQTVRVQYNLPVKFRLQ